MGGATVICMGVAHDVLKAGLVRAAALPTATGRPTHSIFTCRTGVPLHLQGTQTRGSHSQLFRKLAAMLHGRNHGQSYGRKRSRSQLPGRLAALW